MNTVRIVYGFNSFDTRKQIHCASVWLVGVNGETRCIYDVDDTDANDRSTTWKNTALSCAREKAKDEAKFFGVKPERREQGKPVPRAMNYSTILNKE